MASSTNNKSPNQAIVEETNIPEESIPQKKTESKPLRKVLLIAGLGIAILVAGVSGYRWWQYASTHESTDDATVTGNIYAISSRITGTITDIKVNDNQQVQQGQLLVQLDSNPEQVKVQ